MFTTYTSQNLPSNEIGPCHAGCGGGGGGIVQNNPVNGSVFRGKFQRKLEETRSEYSPCPTRPLGTQPTLDHRFTRSTTTSCRQGSLLQSKKKNTKKPRNNGNTPANCISEDFTVKAKARRHFSNGHSWFLKPSLGNDGSLSFSRSNARK